MLGETSARVRLIVTFRLEVTVHHDGEGRMEVTARTDIHLGQHAVHAVPTSLTFLEPHLLFD